MRTIALFHSGGEGGGACPKGWNEGSPVAWVFNHPFEKHMLPRSFQRLGCIDSNPNVVGILGKQVSCPCNPILTVLPNPKQHSGRVGWVRAFHEWSPEALVSLQRWTLTSRARQGCGEGGASSGRGGCSGSCALVLLSTVPACLPARRMCSQQPCQMFPRKAVAERSETHKYFVTFLGFAEPEILRDQTLA